MSAGLTRPRRRLLNGAGLAVLWTLVMMALWSKSRTNWAFPAPAPNVAPTVGISERHFGAIVYLVIRTTDVPVGGGPSPTSVTTWTWKPGAVLINAVITIAATVVGVILYRRWTRLGALVTHCDECGYDLTGAASERCPECGTRFLR